MQDAIINRIEKSQERKRPRVQAGDRVSVYYRLKEGEKERIQTFKGVVIACRPKSGRGPNATFTVRKISEGVGVERVFPLHSPHIDRLEIDGSSEVRRSKLYYLRKLSGKKARLKEKDRFTDLVLPEPEPAPVEEPVEGTTEPPAEVQAASAEAGEKAEAEKPQGSPEAEPEKK